MARFGGGRVAALLLVSLLVACAGPLTAPTATASSTDLRQVILRQIDLLEQQFGPNGATDPQQQTAWLTLHPELQRFHAWYFSSLNADLVRGLFTEHNRDQTPPSMLRDQAAIDRYLAYLATQR